jgi:L-threonate 2-dehydrogenase
MLAKKAVSIVGVGNMGGAMATNLLSRGYSVYVHDIDDAKCQLCKEKGAFSDVDIDKFAINSVVSIICVVDAQQTDDVLFGAQGIARSAPVGHTIMLCPTISPQDVERMAAKLAERGLHTIDAPMSGGPARAADGSMSLMVACADEVYDQHALLLTDLSSKLFRISQRPGDGARTKLVNNLLAAINLVGAAEALVLARDLGLNVQTTLNVIEQSSGQSWIGTDRMQRALSGHTEGTGLALAHVSLLAKDIALALDAARLVQPSGNPDYAGPLGAHASRVFAQAVAAGLANQDDSALLSWLQTTPIRN